MAWGTSFENKWHIERKNVDEVSDRFIRNNIESFVNELCLVRASGTRAGEALKPTANPFPTRLFVTYNGWSNVTYFCSS
jgi:hypothetical protein